MDTLGDLTLEPQGPEEVVRTILRENLAPLIGLAEEQGDNHNIFLEAISPTIAVSSKLTRSLTSRLGKRFASMARALAVARYGTDRVPAVLYSDTLEDAPRGSVELSDDTAVYSQLEQAATRSAATILLRAAKDDPAQKIGTPGFRASFNSKVAELRGLPRAADPWYVRVDLYVDDPAIGLAELESGGELDSSNVKGQPEKLVLAGLALARTDVPLHFCLAYANQGEGRPIRGGLPGYLAYARDTGPSSGLVVGSQWWQRVLPPSLSFARFVEIFAEVARELEIVPPEVRG